MKLIDKLEKLKNTVIDEVSEYQQTVNMSADEYAQRYGYEKILKRIRTEIFKILANNNEELDSNSETIESLATMIAIKRIDDNSLIFLDPNFGEKEFYNINVLTKIFAKDNIDISYQVDDGIEYMIFKKNITKEEKKSLEDTIKSFYENKEEYIEKAKNTASAGIQTAKDVTKKTLRNLADWADSNL